MRKFWTLLRPVIRTYDQKVIDYFENPPNVGSLDKKNPQVGSGKLKSNCGISFLWRSSKVLGQC